MRILKPVLFTGIAALLTSVVGLSAPANALVSPNSLSMNSLTANSLTANAFTHNGLAVQGTATESVVPPLRGLTLPSGASFSLPN